MKILFRWVTAGESHGRSLIAIIEGMVAGVPITSEDICTQLRRRRIGYGRSSRMKFEEDKVTILSGIRHGKTLGGPIAIEINNTEWPKWHSIMSTEPLNICNISTENNIKLTCPRPGHADYIGTLKYKFNDIRPVLERASARETAARVAISSIARNFLNTILSIEILSHVVAIGKSKPYTGPPPRPYNIKYIDANSVRAFNKSSEILMISEIEDAKNNHETLGGIVEVIVEGLPVGLGSFINGESRLDSQITSAIMSIPAIKGVEIGDGFANTRLRGSLVHDKIIPFGNSGVFRSTNHAGGLEGGMTNGMPLRIRAAMKPLSTIKNGLSTLNITNNKKATAIYQRSDICSVPAVGIIMEAMVSLVITRVFLEKFGGDSLCETSTNVSSYLRSLQI